MDDGAFNYNPNANVDDGSCIVLVIEGCSDTNYLEYSDNESIDSYS